MRKYGIPTFDIVLGTQYGDEAKGKITNALSKEGNYTHVVRYSGGGNAGHTITHNGKTFITHIVPVGVFEWNVMKEQLNSWHNPSFKLRVPMSIIGPNCVVHPESFFKEIEELRTGGLEINNHMLKISTNAHIVEDSHIVEDIEKDKIGSTKRGITFAYRDKILKSGRRACDVPELADWLCDPIEELCGEHRQILFEGAQGFGLDISFGDYPYVTSSSCLSSVAMLNGVPPQGLRDIWGAAKIYETYVGTKKFHGVGEVFDKLQQIGNEFGATTGRARQCNWLDLSFLSKSIYVNGVTKLVISKCDIVEELGHFEIINPNTVFSNLSDMQDFIEMKLSRSFPKLKIFWSSSKDQYDR
jgi:adenylosuccinate synthase